MLPTRGFKGRKRGSKPESSLAFRVWHAGFLDLPPVPQLTPFTLSTPMSFCLRYLCQERKFQDLELELSSRTKDVKARLAQLNVQVRVGDD